MGLLLVTVGALFDVKRDRAIFATVPNVLLHIQMFFQNDMTGDPEYCCKK